jgi:hypothetical protein
VVVVVVVKKFCEWGRWGVDWGVGGLWVSVLSFALV